LEGRFQSGVGLFELRTGLLQGQCGLGGLFFARATIWPDTSPAAKHRASKFLLGDCFSMAVAAAVSGWAFSASSKRPPQSRQYPRLKRIELAADSRRARLGFGNRSVIAV